MLGSGVDYRHPELAANAWTNPGEVCPTCQTGVDDDGNGVVDDFRGASFIDPLDPDFIRSGDPRDQNGHETFVASVIASTGNNSLQMAGACTTATLIPVQVWGLDPAPCSNTLKGLDYAIDHGAKIINMSYMIPGDNDCVTVRTFIVNHPGVLFVCTAQNLNQDHDDPQSSRQYPINWPETNILGVSSTDGSDSLVGAGFGVLSVDLFAPGEGVVGLTPLSENGTSGGDAVISGGTSWAAPLVTGIAALLLQQHPNWDAKDVKPQILSTVDVTPPFVGKCVSGGRLNAARALGGMPCD